ncbi:MAG: inositol monophosphatase family protein [Bacteroidota bacterium]
MIDLKTINDHVRATCMEVGAFILNEAGRFSKDSIELKGVNDLVSYVDKQAEQKLVNACKAILPEAGFIAEEGTETLRGEEYNWVIDPLDGTTNFTHGLPIYAISIALMHRDVVILGVVHEINRNECFHAIKAGPAYCNDKIITVADTQELKDSLLATGFPYYNFKQMKQYLSILDTLMQRTHGLRRLGSAAVDLVYVACGRFEGFFEYNLNAWDVAAGAFIVQQAGGQVTDFKGDDDYIFGREIIAAGPIHQEMLSAIKEIWHNQN